MQSRESFVLGRADLANFVGAFRLDLAALLCKLRRTKAVIIGVQVALFMAGRWRREREQNLTALILDVLCHIPEAGVALRCMLERA